MPLNTDLLLFKVGKKCMDSLGCHHNLTLLLNRGKNLC